ncbi:hypothetical protein [Streptomyces sp. 130]|uniref:hypothetical protein n=1 Tax=Streptomyces sp. 130 TaxID=2591006 RepID=UPI00163D401D|nr:hypothetical protein [Streptomyces sp. 130]
MNEVMRETTAHGIAVRVDGGGDGLPGTPWPGPQDPPSPDGGPGVPNPPKGAAAA